MWYNGTYSCGHEGRVNVIGPDRQWKIERHFEDLCPECQEKKAAEDRAKANKEAAEKSAAMELPELIGSEKQVAWANTLRITAIETYEKNIQSMDEKFEKAKRYIREMEEKGTPTDKTLDDVNFFIKDDDGDEVQITKEEIVDAMDRALQVHTDARFWIDSRNDGDALFARMVKEYRKAKADDEVPQDVKAELEQEKQALIVAPEKATNPKDGIVVIKHKDDVLSAQYVKDSTFIDIVKRLHYKWDGSTWSKTITEYTGTADNLAAELGNKLLLSGFTVQFPDDISKQKAISADFVPENDKWIMYTKLDKLTVVWDGYDDTLYKKAKKLPSAKWSNGSMKVNIEYYKDVLDFASTMGFAVSSTAKSKIEEYKNKENNFEKASVKVKETISDKEKLKKSLKSDGTITVLEDLLDD